MAHELGKGLSFPKAWENALLFFLNGSDKTEKFSGVLSNNILGIEYIKALKKLGSSIEPHVIERFSADYHSTAFSRKYC